MLVDTKRDLTVIRHGTERMNLRMSLMRNKLPATMGRRILVHRSGSAKCKP